MSSRLAAASAAGATAFVGSLHTLSFSPQQEPSVLGAIVLFRHGARSPVFHLPDGPTPHVATITAPPAHATTTRVLPEHEGVWRSNERGLLSELGWAQAEALGRRLKARYGKPGQLEVHSTDYSRTVLTAQGVLTGMLGADGTIEIEVDVVEPNGPASVLHIPAGRCPPLAEFMNAGRMAHRSTAASRHAKECVREAFGAQYEPRICTSLAIHDTCQVSMRSRHGKLF